MIKEFDVKEYTNDPYQFARKILKTDINGNGKIKFEPYMYEEGDGTKEKGKFEIQFNHIQVSDWIIVEEALNNAQMNNDPEIGSFSHKKYKSIEKLNQMTIPMAYAGEYISSTETISGNQYNSNTDTYGTMMGSCAYNLFFLYVKGLEKYVVVTQKYMEL